MVTVRGAEDGDLAGLQELLVWWPNGSRLLTSPDLIKRRSWHVFIAVGDDGAILGYAIGCDLRATRSGPIAGSPDRSQSVEIDELLVHPQHHRQGIGKLLVDACEGWARSIGRSRVELAGGPAAVFYEKIGYERVGPAWHYKKELSRGPG